MEPKILDSYGDIRIVESPESPIPLYVVIPTEFTEEELELLKDPRKVLPNYKDIMDKIEDFRTSVEKEDFLRQYLEVQLEKKA